MLIELAVRDLGVIGELSLVLGPGMTAVTGETGAGKTLVVEAIELLVGGRADPSMVRPGATEAVVEGRFVVDGDEIVLRRGRPGRRSLAGLRRRSAGHRRLAGRAGPRAGRPARPARPPVAARLGRAARRARPLRRHRPRPAAVGSQGAAGGRRASSASSAATSGPGRARSTCCGSRSTRSRRPACPIPTRTSSSTLVESVLADALAHQEAARLAHEQLGGDDGRVGRRGRRPWPRSTGGVRSATSCRGCAASRPSWPTSPRRSGRSGESIEDDPERLAEVRSAGGCSTSCGASTASTSAACMDFRAEASTRLAELEDRDGSRAELDAAASRCSAELASRPSATVGRAPPRRGARSWPTPTQAHLRELAMAQRRDRGRGRATIPATT